MSLTLTYFKTNDEKKSCEEYMCIIFILFVVVFHGLFKTFIMIKKRYLRVPTSVRLSVLHLLIYDFFWEEISPC